MFKPTDRQVSLLGASSRLPKAARKRLLGSWAEPFRHEILPILLKEEHRFAGLYGETGRPNWSVARMLGLYILQEFNGLHDQAALDQLSFDSRWQHALDLDPDDAYLSRRSFVEFRSRLVAADPELTRVRAVFVAISAAAIEKLGISTDQQRIDSTHVASNIRTRGRIDLFASTLVVFLRAAASVEGLVDRLPAELRTWYAQRVEGNSGWPAATTSGERAAMLQQLAQWLLLVTTTFSEDAIAQEDAYAMVLRVLDEHCHIEDDDDGSTEGGAAPEGSVTVKRPGKGSGTSLQSPFDAGAGFHPKKGVGYSALITETCGNLASAGLPEIITDFAVSSAGERDFNQTLPTLDRLAEADMSPKTLFGDSHFCSGPILLETAARGVHLHSPSSIGRLPADSILRNEFVFDDASGDLLACPQGNAPVEHYIRTTTSERQHTRHAKMDRKHCESCELRGRCVARPPNSKKGHWHVDIEPDLRARDANLVEQRGREWRERYQLRSGIEATNSELKRRHGMRQLRVRGPSRVTFAIATKLIACNTKRWFRALSQQK